MARSTGRYVPSLLGGSRFQAFIPDSLPPDPPPEMASAEFIRLKERADQALGRLDGSTLMLPDPALFLYQYVRREALLSSQIEGTQTPIRTSRRRWSRPRWPMCSLKPSTRSATATGAWGDR